MSKHAENRNVVDIRALNSVRISDFVFRISIAQFAQVIFSRILHPTAVVEIDFQREALADDCGQPSVPVVCLSCRRWLI